jgi:hypothetical protein
MTRRTGALGSNGRAGRRAIRPVVEAVENRTLLAGSPLVIGALGDSLTDEYMFYGAATPPPPSFPILTSNPTTLPPEIYLTGRDAARNWTMALAALRPTEATFGDFTVSNRGQTRNQGYQENWAENGAAASGPDVSGTGVTFAQEYEGMPQEFPNGPDPMPGLITQNDPSDISIKNIGVVVILIGANDYNAALSAYSSQSDKTDTSVFDQANANIETAISTAVTSIRSAAAAAGNDHLKFVVITTPNITVSPLVQDEAGSSLPALKLVIGEKIDVLDANLALTYGPQPDVGLINSTAIVENFIKDPVLDGVTINMESSGQNFTQGFTGDGFHPGTVVQGLVLQSIVDKINTLEGSQVITPISDADLLNYAENSQASIALTSSASITTVGQGITFTATLTPAERSSPLPTGTVTFEQILPGDSSEPAHPGLILGKVHISDAGVATLTAYHLPRGTYTIAAIYNGDLRTESRLSSSLTQVVTSAPASTSTILYATPNPAGPGQPVTFTALVNADGSGLPTPSGVVTFRDLTTNRVLGTASLNAQGVATLKTANLAVGSNKIVASYGGTTMLAASTSKALVETVKAPPPPNRSTTTHIIPSYFVADGGLKVSLQVIVMPVDPNGPAPTGQVQIGVGPYRVLTVTLNKGMGVITMPYSAAARRLVSAFYLGNGIAMPSGSAFVEINARHGISPTSTGHPTPKASHHSARPARKP